MAARGSSYILADDQADVIIRVKKPVSNSSLDIRDAILREYFGYTELDITELKRLKPDKFFYVREGNETEWASFAQVLKWTTDALGYLSIPVAAKVVKAVVDFREQRVAAAISQALSGISDLELRKSLQEDLQKIFGANSSDRITALSNLLIKTTASLESANKIFGALSYLTDKAGYQDNALLILAKANAALTEAKMRSGPGYDINARTLLAEAIRRTSSGFNFGSDQSSLSLSRQEAAFINRHASFLYSQLGDDKTARERDWLARFYDMSDDERNALKEGDVIELVSPVTAMGTPQPLTDAEKRLYELNRQREATVKMQNEIDQIGSQVVPTDHRTGEYYQKPTDKYELDVLKQRKVRSTGSRDKFKVVHVVENPYSRANVWADGYGAALELPIKAAKYGITLRRLNELTAYLAARDKLLAQIRSERRYAVPPKPATVESLIDQVQRYGRVTVNTFEKNRAQMTLQRLEQLWEESNAFWKNRK